MSKYKEYSQLNIKNTNNPVKNAQTTWIDIFLRKTYRWPTDTWKHAQHHWLSVKCKWGITSWLSEWLLSERSQITSAGEDDKKWQLLYTTGGNVNWYSHYGKRHGGFSKIKNKTVIVRQFHLWAFIWRKQNTNSKRHIHSYILCSIIYKGQAKEATLSAHWYANR